MRFIAVILLLSALLLGFVIAKYVLDGGDPRPGARPQERIQPIVASSPSTAVEAAKRDEDKAQSEQVPSRQSGPLCDKIFEARGGVFVPLPSGPVLKSQGAVPDNSWTLVNVWASWCKPCKEEMPLIAQWVREARARGKKISVIFLSVDDDERQLRRFMDGAGKDIEGEFRWAKAEARSRLYKALALPESTTLPVQVLLDEKGRVRCLRVGSTERSDLEAIEKIFSF